MKINHVRKKIYTSKMTHFKVASVFFASKQKLFFKV